MAKLKKLLLLAQLTVPALVKAADTYDYIVVGSGPGGAPLAANLAKAGSSVLLVEAGDDQAGNLNEEVAAWGGRASNDPLMRWDFFVKYHSDEKLNDAYKHLTWREADGSFYVGLNPPAGATKLGVYYPRAGTLGGCSTHNALASALPSNSDWDVIANITGDTSWSAQNMVNYFKRLENNHYVPAGTPGHGFNGYLDISLNDPEYLKSQPEAMKILQAAAKQMGDDPEKILELVRKDLNNNSPDHDQQTGVFGFPGHMDTMGRRISARHAVDLVVNASNADGTKKYNLTVQTNTLVTKVILDYNVNYGRPRATGVEYLQGISMYSADPRYNASSNGTPGKAWATKEVIISGGTFNSPQILKLSGIGPAEELEKFNITVYVDLPGVGANMQDNYEMGVIAQASQNLTTTGPICTWGATADDPCLALWREGKGPYATGPLDAIMVKTSKAAYNERDLFMWGMPGAFRGFWPPTPDVPIDPPSTFGFSMAKIHPQSRKGTVMLRSTDPRDVPEINFRFFEDNAESDLNAMAEGIEFGRKVFDSITAPLGPFTEQDPCQDGKECDVKEHIKTQAWSHHATSSCAIGADDDSMAVLDSEFRVRKVDGLRVVDASAFPRIPGAFPVLPTFMLSEKAADVIIDGGKREVVS